MDIPLFVSLLLLQLLASAYSGTCPPAADMSPCKCESSISTDPEAIDIECIGSSLKEIEKVFDQLRGKSMHDVKLYNVKGGRPPSTLFQNTSVKNIVLGNCDLQGLSDKNSPVFMGLENSLESLWIDYSIKGINDLKTLDLSHLKRFQDLHLDMNTVREVGNDWFAKGPANLDTVAIQRCVLSKLGDTAFAPLANLKSLSLWGNQLNDIKRPMLPNPASKLISLDLTENNFNDLPKDIFSGMPSLLMVNLAGNSIRRIEEATWSVVWAKLQELQLDSNPLECDSHMEWMFSRKLPISFRGECDSPEGVKGMKVKEFIEKHQRSHLLAGNSSSSTTKN